jgi:predicted NAD/FAD-dependent oxidoreductase
LKEHHTMKSRVRSSNIRHVGGPTATPSNPDTQLEVAVIGAGLSGLACAGSLADAGIRVQVFDKSRGPGGRMATRRQGDLRFDHGAQYFTVRDPRFRRQVEPWHADGLVARWPGTIAVVRNGEISFKDDSTERWVGVPGMSAICGRLASGLEVTYGSRIVQMERRDGRWRLRTDDGAEAGRFDAVVVSAPAPQTAALLAAPAAHLAERAAEVDMAPCWAAMVSFSEPLGIAFDGAFVEDSPLGWISRNNTKPGRPPNESWILHATPDWSRKHIEFDQDVAAQWLVDAFCEAVGRSLPQPASLTAHRWRFALPEKPLSEPCLFDPDLAIAACGDWAGGPRVEGAFLSGCAAADGLAGLRSTSTRL